MQMVFRFLVLQSLMFWQGGFVFYASVVVPIATEELGSSFEQGRISRHVAPWIGIAAFACLALLAVDQRVHGTSKSRIAVWVLLAACQVGLSWAQPMMDGMIDWEEGRHLRRSEFRGWHEGYLSVLGLQWLLALVGAAQMLRGWRTRDLSGKRDGGRPRV